MNRACIAFGSNIGNREQYINRAIQKLSEDGCIIKKVSRFYETEPYGYTDQEKFTNGALCIETELSSQELLKLLMNIEAAIGRVRTIRWGPRVIDLDIIFFNDETIDEDNLKVPHPDMHNRKFVLEPLCEICPEYIHPILNKSIKVLLDELEK